MISKRQPAPSLTLFRDTWVGAGGWERCVRGVTLAGQFATAPCSAAVATTLVANAPGWWH
jgi:hypothetical protein